MNDIIALVCDVEVEATDVGYRAATARERYLPDVRAPLQ
jgi:hypothetical protein